MPFLSDIPVLKYLFGTTTRIKEKTIFFMTAEAEMVKPDAPSETMAGKLVAVMDEINAINKKEEKGK